MKRIVITPTFPPHYPFNREFLASYERHVEDAREVAVHFVVTRADLPGMEALIAEFPNLELRAHTLEDLLAASGYTEEPMALLRGLGKFAYQALKKLYALKHLEYDQALVLDSEALVLKPVRLAQVFDDYQADPVVFYSDLSNRGEHWFGGLSDAAVKNAAKLLRIPYPKMYFLEYYGWIYDRGLIEDLFASFPEGLLTAIRTRLGDDTRIFENQLIYSMLLAHPGKYPHRLVSVNEMLREYLGADGYREYMRFFEGGGEHVGIFEMVSMRVGERNLDALRRLFNDRKLLFYRFELGNQNEAVQRELIASTPITFLVSSEGYARKRERIAVCLSGMPRNARQNLRFVRAFLAENDVDVFFHFWESPDSDFLARALQPKAHAFEPVEAAPAPPDFRHVEKLVRAKRARDVTAMFYSVKQANELKRAYEEEHNFRYDYVVRLRMDFFSTRTLSDVLERIRFEQKGWDRILYVPDQAHSMGLNDQIALGSSETMDAYSATFDGLTEAAEREFFNPEHMLLRSVQQHGLRIRTFPFEYVLTRSDPVNTFDLEPHIKRTRTTWWSAQMPDILPGSLDAYFAANAQSVPLIDALDLELARVYRLRAGAHGYLRFDGASRALGFAPDAAGASLFYVVIPADTDRTVVNIRPRELVLGAPGADGANGDGAAHAYNFYPETDGRVRPDGPGGEDSAFFVRRNGEGLTFEWRAGFWKRVSDPRGVKPRPPGGRFTAHTEERASGERAVLQPGAGGLVVAPFGGDDASLVPFTLERVPDEAAEAVQVGLDLKADELGNLDEMPNPLVVRLLYYGFASARILAHRGLPGMRVFATEYLRKRAHLAEKTDTRGLRGTIVRAIGRRL